MKLIETLTKQDKIDLMTGGVVGIFPTMVLSTDIFFSSLADICLGYYTARSGEKTISPTYDKFREFIEEESITETTAEALMGKLIRGKYIDKWNRIYSALVASNYNVLDEKTFNESKKGNNSDKITYDTVTQDDGKTATNETTTRNSDDDNGVFGFNSNSPVGSDTTSSTSTETVVGEADKNTSENTRTKTGTDTKDITVDESIEHTGRETSAAKLIGDEISLRDRQNFFDIIYRDIDDIATIKIYI